MIDKIAVDGFKNPISKSEVIGILEMYVYGFSIALIAENCNISTKKASAVIYSKAIPQEWWSEASENNRKGEAR